MGVERGRNWGAGEAVEPCHLPCHLLLCSAACRLPYLSPQLPTNGPLRQ
jgi:hypothetical protein